tara:strand:+ start:1425 stop:1871 length:447 start_codon:yes stop_codon:yes gene_type:complete
MKYYTTIKEFLNDYPNKKQELKDFIQIDGLDCRISIFNDNDTIEDICLELDLPINYATVKKNFQRNARGEFLESSLDLALPTENKEIFHKGGFINKTKAKKDLMKQVSLYLTTDFELFQESDLDCFDKVLCVEGDKIKVKYISEIETN